MNRPILATAGFAGRAGGRRGAGGRSASASSAPSLGAHVKATVAVGTPNDPLTTASVTTTPGSLLLMNVGRGHLANFGIAGATPHDNKSNPNYTKIGATEPYALFPDSATALYSLAGGAAGAGYQVSVAQGLNGSSNNDEITMFLAEVLGGSVVQDFTWNEVTSAGPTTSGNVTTTGPALLVAFWWGEDTSLSSISVDASWTIIEQQLLASSNIQGAMAVRVVSAPGTYNATWTASPAQAAQMWVAAVQ
jgi:hypothetical protein